MLWNFYMYRLRYRCLSQLQCSDFIFCANLRYHIGCKLQITSVEIWRIKGEGSSLVLMPQGRPADLWSYSLVNNRNYLLFAPTESLEGYHWHRVQGSRNNHPLAIALVCSEMIVFGKWWLDSFVSSKGSSLRDAWRGGIAYRKAKRQRNWTAANAHYSCSTFRYQIKGELPAVHVFWILSRKSFDDQR